MNCGILLCVLTVCTLQQTWHGVPPGRGVTKQLDCWTRVFGVTIQKGAGLSLVGFFIF